MPYAGELINWSSQNLQATITPDHIVPNWTASGKFERHYAKDLYDCPGHRRIKLTAKWNTQTEAISPLNLLPKLFAAFMGAYLSEGSLDGNRICIYQVKDKEWLREILNETPYTWTEAAEVFRTQNESLANYLRQFGNAKDKFIPAEIRFASPETIKEFIRAYTLGDGHKRVRANGCEEHTIFSTSKRMVDDLSELALKCGWYSSIRIVKPQKSYYAAEERWITNTGGYSITFKKSCDYAEIRNTKQTKSNYSGYVYCLSVSHHTLYVRKNGRPHWNGNTPAAVVAQLQGKRIAVLKEYVSVNEAVNTFAPKVFADLRLRYGSGFSSDGLLYSFIDPAGFQRGQSDLRTCASYLRDAGFERIDPGPIDFESRKGTVEAFLAKHMREGAAMQILERECPTLTEGFQGGYQYPEKANEIEPTKLRPLKNRFSHPHDALQYLCWGIAGKMRKYSLNIPVASYGFQKD